MDAALESRVGDRRLEPDPPFDRIERCRVLGEKRRIDVTHGLVLDRAGDLARPAPGASLHVDVEVFHWFALRAGTSHRGMGT
jgi:hypothetical protein